MGVETILLGTALAATLGSSVHAGQQQAKSQRRSLRAQQAAQDEARTAAASQQRRAEMEQRAADRKTPNVDTLLGREAATARRGPASTMLTGPGGVDTGQLKLGKRTLLGGGGS